MTVTSKAYGRAYYEKNKEKMRAYSTEWKKDNPERATEQARIVRARRKALIDEIKSSPCADCGINYPPHVMDFDHARGEKEFIIAPNRSIALEKLLNEIDKCDVVCANCHRLRTHDRGYI